ncbi:MAG TPA: type-F conjugative transfer system secretin TraK [Rhodanobacteraceae bacterium]|nr:type-F conjugative transfer system secretin TraK [Rhodanobacteraceae bacterium]
MSAVRWLLITALAAAGAATAAEPASNKGGLLIPGLPVKAVDPPAAQAITPAAGSTAQTTSAKPAPTIPKPLGPPTPAPDSAAAAAMPAAAPTTPAATMDAAALRNMVDAARRDLSNPVKPPPHDITVKPGITEIIPISLGRVNRILTPFPDPIIRANRPKEEISRTGNILTVATGSSEDVSLFVWDRSDPQTAISLQLLPRDIPPVEVKLDIAGWTPAHPAAAPSGDDRTWETDQPFVESIKTLFRDLAQGRIPTGFGLEEIKAGTRTDMPSCRWPGVAVKVAQRLEGHVMDALVARAVNTSAVPIELDESACAAPQVLAVAAWPRSRLEPGEDTEVYVAVRRAGAAERENARPSVLRTQEH